MRSMTGYGRGESVQNGLKLTAEVSSVNRKQTEISVNLPRDLEPLEAQIRDEINRRISRGRLNVRITLHAGENGAASSIRVNTALAKAYARELTKLARELHLAGPITLDLLMRAPGVLDSGTELRDAEDFWAPVKLALDRALDGLVRMREREGAHLDQDLRKRVATMRKAVGRINKRAPKMVADFREHLMERIRGAGVNIPGADDERLLKEVVYYADRTDITEELTRLESHFKQFDDCVKAPQAIGRTLDFLAQEINREINTIGSKASDGIISREVVSLKAELEKFREQVQNVE